MSEQTLQAKKKAEKVFRLHDVGRATEAEINLAHAIILLASQIESLDEIQQEHERDHREA